MAWVVKGYIAEQMGFEVDWASAAASTTVVQASRLEGELLKHNLSKEEAAELLRLVPGVSKPSGSHLHLPGRGAARLAGEKMRSFFGRTSAFSVPQASATEVAACEEVLRVEEELLATTTSMRQFLESDHKTIADKIVAFKFSRDDRLVDQKEATDNIRFVQGDLDNVVRQIADAQKLVSHF